MTIRLERDMMAYNIQSPPDDFNNDSYKTGPQNIVASQNKVHLGFIDLSKYSNGSQYTLCTLLYAVLSWVCTTSISGEGWQAQRVGGTRSDNV